MDKLNVKVGDKVICCSGFSYNRTERIATVSRITPTGRIKIDCSEKQYDKYGNEMGNSSIWSCKSYIKELTNEDFERIKKRNSILKALRMANNLKESDIDYDMSLKLIELINKEN